MSDEQKKYWTDDPELVEKYVLGKLSDEERLHLDAEIADCEPCKDKLRHELELAAGIRRHGRDQLKSRLRLRLRKEQSQLMYRYQYISLAAAVVVIAIGVGVYRIWFSDIVAPKKFTTNREIVFQQTEPAQTEAKPEELKDASGEEAVNEKKDEGKLEKISSTKETERRSDRSAVQGGGAKQDKAIADPSAQSLAKTEDSRKVTAQPSEISDAGESVKIKKEIPTQTIWLIGKIVVVKDEPSLAQSKMGQKMLRAEEVQEKPISTGGQKSRMLTIKRDGSDEQIVLQQRSFRELPSKRQTQMARKNLVETLVQQSAEGLSLIIYSDAISSDDIESATVETAGSDTLIIATSSQRIYYRLPAEFQQQTKMRR